VHRALAHHLGAPVQPLGPGRGAAEVEHDEPSFRHVERAEVAAHLPERFVFRLHVAPQLELDRDALALPGDEQVERAHSRSMRPPPFTTRRKDALIVTVRPSLAVRAPP
jgi:hypothetical protein